MDRLSTEKRSWLMSRVAQKNTGPELRVRQIAHALGLRFRLHRRNLPGTPDLVFPRHRVALLVHGCFWHRHPGCRKATTPKSRQDFWQGKFDRNVERDQEVSAALQERGWRVETVWECETRDERYLRARLATIFGLACGGTPA